MRIPSLMSNKPVCMRDHSRITISDDTDGHGLLSVAREHAATLATAAIVLLTVVNVMAVTPPV